MGRSTTRSVPGAVTSTALYVSDISISLLIPAFASGSICKYRGFVDDRSSLTVHSFCDRRRLRGHDPLRENSRKGDLEEQVEGRTVLLHFGPQHRALPRVDDELCLRFGREVPGDRPGPLRLGDHRSASATIRAASRSSGSWFPPGPWTPGNPASHRAHTAGRSGRRGRELPPSSPGRSG